MTLRSIAVTLLAVATMSACAPVAPPVSLAGLPSGQQCFFPSTVTGFKEVGDTAVHVRAGATDVYRVQLPARCDGLRSAEKLLLDSRAGGASVCAGLDVQLILSGATGARRCTGQSIRKLSTQDIAALPAAERP